MKAQAAEQEAFNPYAAPKAAVADAAVPGVEPVFFAVTLRKLTLMSIGTLGLYQIYWFYKNWKCVQQHSGDKVSAPIRAVFYPLVSYALFRRVRERAAAAQIEGGLQAGLLAAAVFVLSFLWRLPDPWWLAGLAVFLPMLPVQSSVNEINARLAPQAEPNAGFSGGNIAGMIVGGLVLLLAVVGMFLPE
jgi:hypothetical protein